MIVPSPHSIECNILLDSDFRLRGCMSGSDLHAWLDVTIPVRSGKSSHVIGGIVGIRVGIGVGDNELEAELEEEIGEGVVRAELEVRIKEELAPGMKLAMSVELGAGEPAVGMVRVELGAGEPAVGMVRVERGAGEPAVGMVRVELEARIKEELALGMKLAMSVELGARTEGRIAAGVVRVEVGIRMLTSGVELEI